MLIRIPRIYEILKRRTRLLHSQIYNGDGLNAGSSRTGFHHRDRIDRATRTVSSAATDESQQECKTSEQHRHPRLEALALPSTTAELYQAEERQKQGRVQGRCSARST